MTTSRARRAHAVSKLPVSKPKPTTTEPDIHTPSAGYVIIGIAKAGEGYEAHIDYEVIGSFVSELDALEWADKHHMYQPHVIAWMNDPNDEIYK